MKASDSAVVEPPPARRDDHVFGVGRVHGALLFLPGNLDKSFFADIAVATAFVPNLLG